MAETDRAGVWNTAWRIEFLGSLRISFRQAPVADDAWRCENARCIVAYLAVHGPSHRERLMDVFWPDKSYPHARANLCSIVRYGRMALGTVTPADVARIDAAAPVGCSRLPEEANLPARGLAEEANEPRGERDGEQRHEHGAGQAREFPQERPVEDHAILSPCNLA